MADGRDELQRLQARCSALLLGLKGPLLDDALTAVGVSTKGLVSTAVAADIGDDSMSGWRRGNPIAIVGRFDVFAGDTVRGEDASEQSLVVRPARRARGPMRVLEQGRHMGNSGGIAGPGVTQKGTQAGTTRRTKNGTIATVRATKGRRWNGYTGPQGTWSDTVNLLNSKAPVLAEQAITDAIRKRLTSG